MPLNATKNGAKDGKRKAENFSNSNLFLMTAAGLSRPREAVAIVDCWIWQIATENLFSKSLILQRQLFATANNSRTQISLPRRHRLKGRNSQIDKKIRGRFPTTSYLETHCEFLSNPNLNKWRNLTAVCSYHRSCKIVVQSLYQKRRWQSRNCAKSPKVISFCPNRTFYAKIANISNDLNDPNDSNTPVIREIYANIRNKYLHKIEKFSIFAVANTKN